MFNMTRPCPGCPFATGPKAIHTLGRRRAEEIVDALLSDKSFSCHKTVKYDDDGNHVHSRGEEHCVGAMIILERMDQPNQMMRIGERVGFYDRNALDLDTDEVFEDFDAFVETQALKGGER